MLVDPNTATDAERELRDHNGHSAGDLRQRHHGVVATGQDDVWAERDQFRRVFTITLSIAGIRLVGRSEILAAGTKPAKGEVAHTSPH